MIKVVIFCISSDLMRATLLNSVSILKLVNLVLHAQRLLIQQHVVRIRLKILLLQQAFAQLVLFSRFCVLLFSAGF